MGMVISFNCKLKQDALNLDSCTKRFLLMSKILDQLCGTGVYDHLSSYRDGKVQDLS